VPGPG
jgi:Sperm-tail PG-rich repeat